MPNHDEKSLDLEKLAIFNLKGGIFPTIEDEILGISSYTAYIPFSKEIENIIKISNNPFKLKVTLNTPKPLSEGELERMRALFLDRVKRYEGDLEMKKRLRLKGLKYSAIIEIFILIGLFYSSFASGYGPFIGIIRFISEFIFWGGLIFIPSVIGPALGGLRYRKRQKGLTRLEDNLRVIEFDFQTDDVQLKNLLDVYEKIDEVSIYEQMRSFAENEGFNLAQEFYHQITKRLSPEDSFVTKYMPAGFRNSLKAMFDIRIEAPDFYSPIGEMDI